MKQDRFLLGILIAIGALVVLALGLFFFRARTEDYGPEDNPAGVVHNYLIALQRRDYERAYGYVLIRPGAPDYETFRQAFVSGNLALSNVSVQIGETYQDGTIADVRLYLVHQGQAPFGDVWRDQGSASLFQNEAGEWKIGSLPYPYWAYDWQPDIKP